MNGKIIIFAIILMIIITTATNVISKNNDLLEVNVKVGKNNDFIGYEIITVNIINHKSEEVLVYCNSTFDRIYGMEIPQFYFEQMIISPNESKEIIYNVKERIGSHWRPINIFNVHINVESEDFTIQKNIFAFRELLIIRLFKNAIINLS